MRRIFRAASVLLIVTGLSAPALANNLTGNAVILRTLDKVTATTEDYTVKVGDTLTYGSLSIDVKHCEKRPPEEIPETYAFLKITENPITNSGEEMEPVKLFSGWMLASSPAVSALDHGVYDVWVLDCKVPS